mgnify:CR=1 FL=1
MSARFAQDRLVPGRAGLIVIDIQERLVSAMPAAIAAAVVHATQVLIEAAKQLAVPIVVSEQYPKGLGRTVPGLADALASAAHVHRLEKTLFSVAQTGEWARLRTQLGRDQWVVAGMETHICVAQTVRDLRRDGAQVAVAADAVCSRSKANWRVGLDLARSADAQISSSEAVAFEWLGGAGGDAFKAISKLIK